MLWDYGTFATSQQYITEKTGRVNTSILLEQKKEKWLERKSVGWTLEFLSLKLTLRPASNPSPLSSYINMIDDHSCFNREANGVQCPLSIHSSSWSQSSQALSSLDSASLLNKFYLPSLGSAKNSRVIQNKRSEILGRVDLNRRSREVRVRISVWSDLLGSTDQYRVVYLWLRIDSSEDKREESLRERTRLPSKETT